MTPKALDKYPNSYSQIIRRAFIGGVRIDLESKQAANRLRTSFYQYRTVLFEESLNDEDLKPLSFKAEALRFTIDNASLLIVPKNRAVNRDTIERMDI